MGWSVADGLDEAVDRFVKVEPREWRGSSFKQKVMEEGGVGVADLARAGRGGGGNDFAAGGKMEDARRGVDEGLDDAEGGEEG